MTALVMERRGQVSETPSMLRGILLICGVLSSLLYVGADLLAGTLWEGYNFTNQAISELSAIGAPTRPLVVPLLLAYDVLVIAFGLGAWGYVRKRALRVTGGLLVGIGALGLVWVLFPMHLPRAEPTLTDTIHSVLAGVNVLLFLLAMGFGALAAGRWFRLYAIGTLATLLVLGAVSFLMAVEQVAAQGVMEPPQWFGFIERIDAYGSMLWVAVLAIVVLRAGEGTGSIRMQTAGTRSN